MIVDKAAAKLGALGPVRAHQVSGHRAFLKILHVDHAVAVWDIARKYSTGFLSGDAHPAAVELELDQLRIGFREENVVAGLAAAQVAEFEVVIVVGVLKAGGFGLSRDVVGQGSVLLKSSAVCDRDAWIASNMDLPNGRRGEHGADHILYAESMRLVEQRAGIGGSELEVSAGAFQAGIVNHLAEVGGESLPKPAASTLT